MDRLERWVVWFRDTGCLIALIWTILAGALGALVTWLVMR